MIACQIHVNKAKLVAYNIVVSLILTDKTGNFISYLALNIVLKLSRRVAILIVFVFRFSLTILCRINVVIIYCFRKIILYQQGNNLMSIYMY